MGSFVKREMLNRRSVEYDRIGRRNQTPKKPIGKANQSAAPEILD